jgi:hypothetical protein
MIRTMCKQIQMLNYHFHSEGFLKQNIQKDFRWSDFNFFQALSLSDVANPLRNRFILFSVGPRRVRAQPIRNRLRLRGRRFELQSQNAFVRNV